MRGRVPHELEFVRRVAEIQEISTSRLIGRSRSFISADAASDDVPACPAEAPVANPWFYFADLAAGQRYFGIDRLHGQEYSAGL